MPRPIIDTDIPILRHFTFREAHLFIVGVWYGIDAAVKLATGRPRAARRVFQETRAYVEDDSQQHDRPDLLRGLIRDAWYLLGGFTLGFLAAIGVLAVGLDIALPGSILGGGV